MSATPTGLDPRDVDGHDDIGDGAETHDHPDSDDSSAQPDDERPAIAQATLEPCRPLWATVIRAFAFVRKEVVEILRQPRLIALLVLGPFALLVAFGYGYGNDSLQKRAVFVGGEESIYADVLDSYEDELDDFIDSRGLVPTVDEGVDLLDAGDVDVVVVFPEDPETTVMNGERAVIEVLHGQIDPIQGGAVEIAARLAIQEVNATVLATIASSAQTEMQSADEYAETFAGLATEVEQNGAGSSGAVLDAAGRLSPALDGSAVVLSRLQPDDPELTENLESTRQLLMQVSDRAEQIDESATDEDVSELAANLRELSDQVGETLVLDPDVLVRPFASETVNVAVDDVRPVDYFTPASLALLLQHLALTFAALSLVRDRRTGLFELMRVGPLSSIEIVVGKIFAYLIVGCAVAAGLVAASAIAFGLDATSSIGWLALLIIGVLLSSLSLGMVLANFSRTESQAVQYAMLVLLAGLFFSGFVLPIDTMHYPVKLIAFMLPVTYGIEGLHDIMLRGTAPDDGALIGLGALVVVYGATAVVGLTRRLRTSAG